MRSTPVPALIRCGVTEQTRVLAAVSGGADSTALLLLLADALKEKRISALSAAYYHHGLRKAADDEAAFCESLAERLGIPFYTARGDVKAAAEARGMGTEEAARFLRYEWLRNVREESGADVVALAHHADDRAETVLMRMIRGTGTDGLSGMSYRNGILVRPLLDIRHEALVWYLTERGERWCTDESNGDPAFFRNRIRHELLPMLKTFNPRIEEALCRLSESAADDRLFFEAEAGKILENAKNGSGYEREKLLGAPPPVRKRALKMLLSEWLTYDFTAADVERLEQLLTAPSGARATFRDNVTALADGAAIVLEEPADGGSYERTLTVGETVEAGGYRITCRLEQRFRKPQSAMEAYLSCGTVGINPVFTLRRRRDGDRFRPLGMEGTKLLSDIFTDRKTPRRLRGVPLVLWNGSIAFVPGYTIDDALRVKDNENVIHITVTEVPGC